MTAPLAIFDMDNTLLDRAGAVLAWAERFVAERGLDPADVAWILDVDGDGFAPRQGFAAALRDRYGLAESPDGILEAYRADIVELIEPYPDTSSALAQLRAAGWRLAIATNGQNAQQRRKIARAGLAEHVDGIVVSEEAGADKPDPRVFHLAAQRCGAPLSTADWMVGDCPTRDVGGARALGLRTVWMRRDRAWDPTDGTGPHAVADTVEQAVSAILAG